MLDGLVDWISDVIQALGYGGVAFLVALESVFPPIPSEVVLPLAGFVAGRGDASVPGMILAATIGSVVGAWILYGAAAAIGPVRLHGLVVRRGRWLGVGRDDLERAEAWFDRRGGAAVVIGRCVPLIRSIVSVPAGFRRMPVVRFTVLTAAGSTVWNGVLIGAGAALGDRWEEVGDVVGVLQWAVVIAVVLAVGWWAYNRLFAPWLARRGLAPPPEHDTAYHDGGKGSGRDDPTGD